MHVASLTIVNYSDPWVPNPVPQEPAMSAPHAGSQAEPAARLPIHPFPTGWFAVAFSEELPVGGVLPLRWLGRDVVAFRGTSGRAAVVEAWCPHLGAHLGHGGRVDGDLLRCPMHHFGFDGDGACKGAGRGYGRPLGRGVPALEVREQSGLIMAWHAQDGGPPTWEPPPLCPEGGGQPVHRIEQIRTHVQELAENLFDIGHFAGVHGYISPRVVRAPEAEGPVIRVSTEMGREVRMFGRTKTLGMHTDFSMHGLGVFFSDSATEGGLRLRLAITSTPTDPEQITLRFSLWILESDASIETMLFFLPKAWRDRAMAQLIYVHTMEEVRHDKAILDHKRHLTRPCFGDADVGVPAFRRWVKQFSP